jgi:hypothetical protein
MWLRVLKRGSAAVRFRGLGFRIPLRAYRSLSIMRVVCCQNFQRRADHSSGFVLRNVLCLSVTSKLHTRRRY